jgi:hypothetical protein
MQLYPSISLILLALLLWVSSAAAQMVPIPANILKPRWTGLGGGYGAPGACVARGRTIYLVARENVALFDLSIPALPRLLDTLRPGLGPITHLRVDDDTVLVVASGGTFALYSIADPHLPRLLLRRDVQGLAGVAYAHGRLYYNRNSTDRHGTSYLVDVSDWAQPRQLGTLNSALAYGDVQVVGDLLLIDQIYTDDASFLVYRIGDSAVPKYIEEWAPPNDFLGQFSLRDSIGICISSGLAGRFLSTVRIGADGKPRVVADYLNDGTISPIASTLSGSTIVVAGMRATAFPSLYATTLVRGTLLWDGTVTFTDTLVLSIYRGESLSRFSGSSLVATDSAFFLSTEYTTVTGTAGSDNRVITTGGFTLPGLVLDVAMHGRRAHALTNRELVTLDFTHPDRPDTLSRIPFIAERLVLAGPTRLIAADSLLRLIDVADPRAPRILGAASLGRNRIATRIAASSSVVAAVMPGSSVELFTLAVDSIRHVAALPLPASDVALRNDTLYVAALDSTLTLWDISHPDAPRRLAPTITSDKPLIDVSISGDTLMAASDWWTRYYRIGDLPSTFSFGLTNGTMHARFLGRYLFHCQLNSDMRVLDFESEFGGRIVGEVGTVSDANFALQDSLLVAAAQYLGLRVYAVDTSLATLAVGPPDAPRIGYGLSCEPNPARYGTIIRYSLRERSRIRITVEDMTGRRVALLTEALEEAGEHSFFLDTDIPSGTYFIIIDAPGGSIASPMIVQH